MNRPAISRVHRPFPTARLLAVACASALAVAGPASGQTWGGGVGNWDTDADWIGGIEPDENSDATINAGTVSVTLLGEMALELFVGKVNGSSGTLNVENGGAVSSRAGYIGDLNGSTGAVTVTGAGSTWTTGNYSLFVGKTGDGTLNVEDGGDVSSMTGIIGEYGIGVATVTGAGSTWTTNNSSLIVGIHSGSNGTLIVKDGGAVSSGVSYVGNNFNSTGLVTVTGAGSSWSTSSLAVGNNGDGTLNIEDGGIVSSGTGHVGFDGSSTSVATVTGTGSSWAMSNDLFVGRAGDGTLNIEAGGAVSNKTGYLGHNDAGIATVTGAGSTWTNTGDLYIGTAGTGTLNLLDLGHASAANILHGAGESTINVDGGTLSAGNIDIVNFNIGEAAGTIGSYTHHGGTFDATRLTVGGASTGTLTIDSGATALDTNGIIGDEATGIGTATVTGAGSTWATVNSLFVGNAGDGTLNIEAGGAVSNIDGYIGDDADSTGLVTVTGSGSVWSNSFNLYVGNFGNGTLNVENGGAVDSYRTGYLGYAGGATGTTTVTGAGSTWTHSNELHVGYFGDGTLNVEDGGTVSSGDSVVGNLYNSVSAATVTGTGSSWNTDSLTVGYYGDATLNVEDGGIVSSSRTSEIATFRGSISVATVTGAGSSWAISNELFVGRAGNGTLSIEAGGAVSSSRTGYIGDEAYSTGLVTVSGSGSVWTIANRYNLLVGNAGKGTLNVEEGGHVSVGTDLFMQANGGTAYLNFILTSTADPLIDVAGNASLAGELTVGLDESLTLVNGDVFTLIDIGGTRSGVFSNFAQDDLLGTFNGIDLHLSYTGGDGNDVVAYAVPEPTSLALLAFGGLLLTRRRRRAA